MNQKTLDAVKRHGLSLLAAFPNCTEKDPVALCKKLRRIETATHRVMTDYCNGDATMEQADAAKDKAKARIASLLMITGTEFSALYINRDPRGHALKLDSESDWFRHWQELRRESRQTPIYQDWGGYGILAPDLNQ